MDIQKILKDERISYSRKLWKKGNIKIGAGAINDVVMSLTEAHFNGSIREAREQLTPVLEAMENPDEDRVSPAVKLWEMFSASDELKKFAFIRDESSGSYILCRKTGRKQLNCVEVEPLTDPQHAKAAIMQSLKLLHFNGADQSSAKLLHEYLLLSYDLFREYSISYVSEPQEKRSFTYCLIDPVLPKDNRASIPAWNEFLNRLSDAKAFCAYVWSLYERRHRGRQALYLQGVDGEDGKSTIIRIIQEMFGHKFSVSMQPSAFSQDDRFSLSSAYGKRLMVVPDITNQNIVKYPKMKQITGGDFISIEYKNGGLFTVIIDCRIIIVSNYGLKVEDASHERSRILWLIVNPIKDKTNLDPDWTTKLRSEWNEFLAYCKHCYDVKTKDHYNIVSKSSDAVINSSIKDESVSIEDILNRLFVFGKPGAEPSILRWDFSSALEKIGIKSRNQKIYKDYLTDCGYADFALQNGYQTKSGTKVYRGLRLRTWDPVAKEMESTPGIPLSLLSSASSLQPRTDITDIDKEVEKRLKEEEVIRREGDAGEVIPVGGCDLTPVFGEKAESIMAMINSSKRKNGVK